MANELLNLTKQVAGRVRVSWAGPRTRLVTVFRINGPRARLGAFGSDSEAFGVAKAFRHALIEAVSAGATSAHARAGTSHADGLSENEIANLLTELELRDAEAIKDELEGRHIRAWMRLHAREFRNSTDLAEACADALDHDEWLDDESHQVWDLAIKYLDNHGGDDVDE